MVRCKGMDLKSDEIQNHLAAGMQVTKLSLTWDENVSFVLDEEFGIRRLKFGRRSRRSWMTLTPMMRLRSLMPRFL